MTSPSPFSDQAAMQQPPQQQEAEEESAPQSQKSEAELRKDMLDNLKEIYGDKAPTEEAVNAWKSQCGRLRVMWFGDEEVYFFRPFRVAEYRGWLESLRSVAEKDPQEADKQLLEKVITNCVLFPKLKQEDLGSLYGGTLDSLYAQIRMASNFYPMEHAVMLVQEW